ncbi:alpha/beta fold hydrolase [Xylanibacillus composti]|uniref:Alpha/beta hydrolase n=1 Tax=Xylanibacillus composti TaxID=1572762 RepID=A0A8J4H1T5_9BACL|nr:alpha/beta fold hydrolase [Xylanibacillus composti]MDT9726739.1 alpha/beta fold hydrolase [Xylanibacillus composti]GIQ69329.1 alpha/beta hydrolase [Xylanibacillus composti]
MKPTRGNEHFIELEDNEGRLAGVLHLPKQAAGPSPAVVYCPGKNGERYEVHRLAVKFARRLAEKGIAFLRYDYYGMGLSDGHYYEVTTSTKVSNARRAYAFASARPEIDKARIAFLGFSDGARIALMAANRTDADCLLLWSPLFYEFGGKYLGPRPRFARHERDPQQLVVPWAGLWVGIDFFKDLQQANLAHELSSYRGHSLLIYGDNDPLIREELDREHTDRHAIYSDVPEHQVTVVANAGHLFTSVALEEQLMARSVRWLEAQWHEKGGEG